MITPIFVGDVKGGRLVPREIRKFNQYLQGLEGREVDIVVGKPKRRRSSPENRYFHGVVIKILADAFGYTPEEMKDIVRTLFFSVDKTCTFTHPKTKKSVTREIRVVKSTAEWDTVEFEDRMERIRQWADTFDIHIPLPNEVNWDDFE